MLKCKDLIDEIGRVLVRKGGEHEKSKEDENCAVMMKEPVLTKEYEHFYSISVQIKVHVQQNIKDEHSSETRPGVGFNVRNIRNYDMIYLQ